MSGCTNNQREEYSFKTFSDERISIQYPSYMEPVEDSALIGIAHVVFSTTNEKYPAGFVVIFTDFEASNKEDLKFTDLRIISEENVTILGKNSTKIIYEYNQDPATIGLNSEQPIPIKAMRTSTEIEGGFVQLRFIASEGIFEKYISDVTQMVYSFKLN